MATKSGKPVVVGVDGSEQSDRAVRYAAVDAARRESTIKLVHAVQETAPMAAMLPVYSVEAFLEVGRRMVDDARALLGDLVPDIQVTTSVRPGSRVGLLVDAGDDASVVVLGHRARTFASRVLTSSTTTGVAARSHCPVVSVPDTWTPQGAYGRVVVGVDHSEASHDALAVAFEEARRRSAALTVVHAWRLPSAYDDVGYAYAAVDEWLTAAGEEMEHTLAPFRSAFPDVEAEVSLRHEYPGPALVAATEAADLIVVGRRGHGAPFGIYLGSLARMLVREAACPVEIVPQHPRHTPSAEERLMTGDETQG